MKKLVLLLLLLQAFPVLAGIALKRPHPLVRGFSVAQGLPSSETYYVHQDRDGYLWFCTDRGVVRYDGYRLKTFTRESGLVDNTVFRIYEDHKGRLWFLSAATDLCYYENGRIVRYRYNHLLRKYNYGFTAPHKDLYIDPRNGDLTFTTYSRGVVRISANGKMSFPRDPDKDLAEVVVRDGKAYFYTVVKIWRGQEKKKFKAGPAPFYLSEGQQRTYCGEMTVKYTFRVVYHRGTVFVSTANRLYAIRNGRIREIPLDRPVIALHSIDGDLWLGLYEQGVRRYRFDQRRNTLTELDRLLPGQSVSCVLKDREGGFWFSTLENGVRYMPYSDIRHYTKREGLVSRNITCVTGLDDHLFVVGNYRQLQDISMKNLPVWWSDNHNVVLGTLSGKLLVSWTDDKEVHHYPEYMVNIGGSIQRKSILTTRTHYVRSLYGIYLCDLRGNVDTLFKEGMFREFYRPMTMLIDNRNRLFMGSEFGLARVRNELILPLTMGGLLKDTWIEDLLYHPAYGSIAATRGKGVVFFDGEKLLGNLTTSDGLLSNQLNFCYVDTFDRLWVGSNKGLDCIRRAGNGYSVEQYTVKNGLLTNEVNSVYVYGNRVWIASKKGLTELVPGNGKTLIRPEVFLEEIRASSVGKVQQVSPVFESGTTYVKILFRTTNYRGSPFHRFRYRFAAGAEWTTSADPEILLNNPKYGDYRLEISWLDESGSWSRPKPICTFAIESPFYLKWYFFVGISLLALGLGFLLFRLRIRQLDRRYQLQKTINRLEQKALRAQMNPHFIFNSLNSIQSFLVYEENEKAERFLLKFAQLIRQTLNNSRESYITIETEMETLRRYLELEQMRFKDRFDFEITCLLTTEELRYGVPPMLVQPFVENAVLHGFKGLESGGKIGVRFDALQNNCLLCVVDDNGVGRKATEKQPVSHQSFGTKITAERLAAFREKYGDDFAVETIDKMENGRPAGTRVLIRIPVVPLHDIPSEEE